MKILLSLLLLAAGAGFALHDHLQTWLRLPRTGKAETYYLRAAHQTTNPDGAVVRWSPGQPLRTTTQATATTGAVALTDGANVLQVPLNALTRDPDEAAVLRQTNLVSENAARNQMAQEAARQSTGDIMADAQPAHAYQPESASAASAPVYYYRFYVAPAPASRNLSAERNRAKILAILPPRHHGEHPRPTPATGR